jgi:hypothetical protein
MRPKVTENDRYAARVESALSLVLSAIARPALQMGITPGYFDELSRRAFVSAAAKMSKMRNGRVNKSRVSVITGLSRSEVKKLLGAKPLLPGHTKKQQRAMRVLIGWHDDKRFQDRRGRLRSLRISGGRNSFATLVKDYAGDVTPKSVLEELKHMSAVKLVEKTVHVTRHTSPIRPRDVDSFHHVAALVAQLMRGVVSDSSGSRLKLHSIEIRATDPIALQIYRRQAEATLLAALAAVGSFGKGSNAPRKRALKHYSSIVAALVGPS